MLLALKGVPAAPFAGKKLAAYLHDSLKVMEDLAPWRDRLIWHDPDPMTAGVRFRSGQAALYAGNLGLVLPHMAGVRFRWNGDFAVPEAGLRLEPGCTFMGIPANTPRAGSAGDVLRFLVSAAAQDQIAQAGMNATYRKASNGALLAHLRAGDAASLDAALGALAIRPETACPLGHLVFYELRALHREVLEGRRTAAAAAAVALELARSRLGRKQ